MLANILLLPPHACGYTRPPRPSCYSEAEPLIPCPRP